MDDAEQTVNRNCGLSDGDPEVHAQLKDIVKAKVDAIVENLRASGPS